MGVGPPLPAPTDPSSLSSGNGNSGADTDLATDLSRRTDRTSYSIPEDGSPVTISTRRKRQDRDKAREKEGRLTRASHHSQTSLLIEYFEGGKGRSSVQSRPSVRVKVTPSAARKIKDANEHIQITEAGRSTRQPSYTKRISLSPNVRDDGRPLDDVDDTSQSSFASAAEESTLHPRRPPIEIEVMRKDDGSPGSATSSPRDSRYIKPNPSEISSMPPDSLLEGHASSRTPRRRRSRSLDREKVVANLPSENLKTPSRRRSRSLSRERITQKVIEKLGVKAADASTKHTRRSKSRSRSGSKDLVETVAKSARRRSSRTHRDDEPASGAESSLLTTSQLSPSHKSGDQYSFRSGTSKSSLNNPRLLDTVEDAIRRLILPELNALKHEQKTQKNRSRFEETTRDSVASGPNAASRDESRRRVSKTSSAPNVSGKPKVVLNQDEHGRGVVLSGDSIKGRKERRSSRGLTGSPFSKPYERGVSEETLTDGRARGKRSKDHQALKDAAALGTTGALTAAALRHHDSRSSVDRDERRKRRSKSRSRSTSLAEHAEYSVKEDIPPMPLSSEINGSELTRESILTAPTERPHSAASQDRQVSIGHVSVSQPSRHSPRAIQQGLGVHHSNASRGNLSVDSQTSYSSLHGGGHVARAVEAGLAAAAAAGPVTAGSDLPVSHGRGAILERNHVLHHGRSLSPIQSVASYGGEDSNLDPRRSFLQTHSAESLSSLGGQSHGKNLALSVESVSSSPSSVVARARRSQDPTSHQRDSVLPEETMRDSEYHGEQPTPKDTNVEHWHDDYHGDGLRPPKASLGQVPNDTDESLDGTYLDKMAAGQHIIGVGQNPQYRRTPVAVASAVASLHNPSVLDVHSTRSGLSRAGDESTPSSLKDYRLDEDRVRTGQQGSPTRRRKPVASGDGVLSASQKSVDADDGDDYYKRDARDRLAESVDHVAMGASSLPVADDPLPEIGHGLEDESDINTNPSIIQGPIGGVHHGNRDHWPYEPTPPQANGQFTGGHTTPNGHGELSALDAGILGAGAAAGLGVMTAGKKREIADDYGQTRDLTQSYDVNPSVEDGYTDGVNHDFGTRRDSYQNEGGVQATPLKDEGYISAANPRSPVAITPESKNRAADLYGDDEYDNLDGGVVDDDPFVGAKHMRHLSGHSHGMPSPLYDGATGRGMERIQSKDIVALMDHLTVRDAQRNARDTEILVTLVRSAAEMRNSFEDMKKFLAEQEGNIINTTEKNTERSLQKVINGPRPLPLGTPRGLRRISAEDEMGEDIPTKRRNVFRRALKGLSMRSSNDLTKIEDMLVQLLGDVEGLKAAQEPRMSVTQPNSLNSYDNLQTVPEGYEPEGQAGTGSTNHSGSLFSNPPSRQPSAMKGLDSTRVHEHRISTVPEGDEELAAHEEDLETPYEKEEQLLSPGNLQIRGSSLPLDSPPQIPVATTSAYSNENTPRTDKSRKHKSNSSSIFPKISRWSETTASTVAKQFRGSGRKEKEYYAEGASRSGSEVDVWQYNQHELQDDDRLRSSYSLDKGRSSRQENRPASPLIPHSTHEDPKYQVHRDSRNLQHPQPRQGPTHRYQYQLESQAHHFDSPVSPTSEQWASNPNLARFSGGSGTRYSGGAGNLSPISDGDGRYSASAASATDQTTGPPRPPKIPDDPLIPARPPKVAVEGGSSSGGRRYADEQRYSKGSAVTGDEQRYSNGSGSTYMNGSPRSVSGRGGLVPQRKPTGPRPISSNNNK